MKKAEPRSDVKCEKCGQQETTCHLEHVEVILAASLKLNTVRYSAGKRTIPADFAKEKGLV